MLLTRYPERVEREASEAVELEPGWYPKEPCEGCPKEDEEPEEQEDAESEEEQVSEV